MINSVTKVKNITYAWYVVVILTLCYVLSFIDRQILSLLVGPIKKDLGITDTQVGLLGGFAFSLFYTVLGLPIGRLVDRYNRRNIISIGIIFWSLATAVCAFARTFSGLFLARMGVGVGEAALNPAAISMISDSFPKEKLSSALSFYSMGIYLGSGLALLLGGVVVQSVAHTPFITMPIIGQMESWRISFLVVGLPGLVLAMWVFTLKEPLRHNAIVSQNGQNINLSIRETMVELMKRWQSVLGISGAQTAMAVAVYGFMLWGPVFFQRIHGWDARQTGLNLGAVVLVGGCLGMYVGGRIADKWISRGVTDAALRLGGICAFGGAVFFGLGLFLSGSAWLSLLLFFPGILLLAMPTGSCYAALQVIMPNQVRGQAIALFLLIANLGGMTFGPLMPGALNDYIFFSDAALGSSLGWTLVCAMLMAALIFTLTRASYKKHYSLIHD